MKFGAWRMRCRPDGCASEAGEKESFVVLCHDGCGIGGNAMTLLNIVEAVVIVIVLIVAIKFFRKRG